MAVALLTLLGLALRLARLDQSLINDELSTLFITERNDLPGTISQVATDAEISPPFYFVLAWLSTHLGSAPELVRLPALIAGTLTIPLTYLVGRRAVGPTAGVIAAAVMTLSPYMIYFSTDGRAYSLAIALVMGSTLAMLIAADRGGTRWWVLYGLLSCLAVYSHYTTAFALGAQLLWLLWAHPEARRPALLANVAAGVAFAPWLPSALADTDSPTIEILAYLQGSGFEVKRAAVQTWVLGYPNTTIAEVSGHLARLLVVVGGIVAIAAAVATRIGARRGNGDGDPWISKGMVLVLALALATPVTEAVMLLFGGTDLFGARNLNASSGGLALTIGAVLAAAGPWVAVTCATAVLGGFAIGAVRTLDVDNASVDLKSAAAFIEDESRPGDVIVDGSIRVAVTPVPLTSLDAHLSGSLSEYRLGLPTGPPPFLPLGSPVPATEVQLEDAFQEAGTNRVILVATDDAIMRRGDLVTSIEIPASSTEAPGDFGLPAGSRIVEERRYRGFEPINVFVIQPGPEGG